MDGDTITAAEAQAWLKNHVCVPLKGPLTENQTLTDTAENKRGEILWHSIRMERKVRRG